MASIPSSGSLMATHNYHRRRLSSTSSNSSCSSSEYSGEVIPHPPGLPKSDPRSLVGQLLLWEDNSPSHDNRVGVPRELGNTTGGDRTDSVCPGASPGSGTETPHQ